MSTHEPKRGRVVILTSRPIEYAAVRIHLTNLQEETHLKGTVYERGTFIDWEIGIVQIDTGNVAAAIEAERAIAHFDPTIVLFVGIADGLNGVAPGDVVAARKIYGYESGQEQGTLFLPQSDVGNSSYYLIERAKAEARKTDWKQRIPTHIASIAASPDVFIGAIAAGEKIISSTQSPTFGLLQAAYSDTLAVEMEGRGFLLAAHMNEQLQALVVRGIVALIDDTHKNDVRTSQTVAAHHACAFAFEILAKLAVQQAVLSKTQQDLQLVDVYSSEKDADSLLDITLHNAGTRVALPTRVKIDILDVGEFYYGDEDDIDRSFLIPTHQYEIELSPDLKGKSKAIKISHLLNPGDTDRFQVLIEQDFTNPHLAYIWYYLKITIIYNKQKEVLESVPLLLSVPPVDSNKYNIWQAQNGMHAQQNRITLRRMAALTDKRSESVEKAIKIFL